MRFASKMHGAGGFKKAEDLEMSRKLTATITLFLVTGLAGPGVFGGSIHGPIVSPHDFPSWYQDPSGLALQPCLATTEDCGPAEEISTTFPNPVHYWIAEARMYTYGGKGGNPDATRPGGQATATLTMELLGTFPLDANGDRTPFAGGQLVIQSLQFRIDSLLDQQLYTVTTPFGVFADIVANVDYDSPGVRKNNADTIKETIENPDPSTAGDFDQSTFPVDPYSTASWSFTGMDRFLTCVGGPQPTGFLGPVQVIEGEPTLVECTITGSPLGPAHDVFRVEGPEVGGGPNLWNELQGTPFATGLDPWVPGEPPIDMIETTQFRIVGQVFTPGDTDADGIPDASDNCPLHFNPTQLNQDADSLGDVCDCNPLDSGAGQPPLTSGVVADTLLTGATQFTWAPTPFADRYEILRGDISNPSTAECATGRDPIATDTEFIESEVPLPGVCWYFLIRGVDAACGGPGEWGGPVGPMNCP